MRAHRHTLRHRFVFARVQAKHTDGLTEYVMRGAATRGQAGGRHSNANTSKANTGIATRASYYRRFSLDIMNHTDTGAGGGMGQIKQHQRVYCSNFARRCV